MAVWRSIDFSVTKAQRLADLTGIKNDLDTVQSICSLLLAKMEQLDSDMELEDVVLRDALCAAAIIRYGRALGSGVRGVVPNDLIKSLPPELEEAHRLFKDLRNKWIAHSVNAFEINQVRLFLTPGERGPKRISSVSVQQRVTCLEKDKVQCLKTLATAVAEKVGILIEQEDKKVLEFARSRPVDSFYSQIDQPIPFATYKDVGTRRRNR